MISPELLANGSLQEGEDEGCQRPLLDVEEAKAPLHHSPVKGLHLGLLEHIGVNERLCLAGEIFYIFHPGVNNIASVVTAVTRRNEYFADTM